MGISQITLKKIPLGEKIIINTSRPSLVVGSKGANIKDLTKTLKTRFKLENPQIEINEVKNIFLDANIVAEQIASSLERFGSARFKGTGHKTMANVIRAGAMGVEIIISGKIPGSRAKNWRFYQGYLKKCGDVAVSGVRKAQKAALLKSGIIGIKVAIMPPDVVLPDRIEILDEPIQIIEEIKEEEVIKKGKTKKKAPKKKTVKKKVIKKGAKVEIATESKPVEEKIEAVVEEKTEETVEPIAEVAEEKTEEVVAEEVKTKTPEVEEKASEVKTEEKTVEDVKSEETVPEPATETVEENHQEEESQS